MRYVFLSLRGFETEGNHTGGVSAVLNSLYQKQFPWLFSKEKKIFLLENGELTLLAELDKLWENYYLGMTNRYLWKTYVSVNKLIAKSLVQNISLSPDDVIFINDYQLMMVANNLRGLGIEHRVTYFHHIPWPPISSIKLSQRRFLSKIARNLLSCNIVGFQTDDDANNFLSYIQSDLSCTIKKFKKTTKIVFNNSQTLVKVAPVGIDFEKIAQTIEKNKVVEQKDIMTILSVDRIDYTKGIVEKLQYIDQFLMKNREYLGKFRLMQIINPSSRLEIPIYKNLRENIIFLTNKLNEKYHFMGFNIISLIEGNYSFKKLIEFYRQGDIFLVNSRKDGMNLVSKEFIAANSDRMVCLLLSTGVGSSYQLAINSLVFHPDNYSSFSSALIKAFKMTNDDKKQNLHKMIKILKRSDCHWWFKKLMTEEI